MVRWQPVLIGLFLIALVFICTPVRSEQTTYTRSIYEFEGQNGSLWIGCPTNSSTIGFNSNITFTIYAANVSASISAWGKSYTLQNNELLDIPVLVAKKTSYILLYSDSNSYRLEYNVQEGNIPQWDPIWQDIVDDETDKIKEASEQPTLWLWTPVTWGLAILITMLIATLGSATVTRLTLLIDWLNTFNFIAIGAVVVAYLINFVWMALVNDNTARGSLLAFAYMSLRMLIITAIAVGWFTGNSIARYGLNIVRLWKIDLRRHRITEILGVEYTVNGESFWAVQSFRRAILRLWYGVHIPLIIKGSDMKMRQNWEHKGEFGISKVHIVNDVEFKDKSVVIDATGHSVQKVRIIDPSDKKRKIIEVITDLSNFGHLLGCTFRATNDADHEEHCDTTLHISSAYELLTKRNRELTQRLLVIKNEDVNNYIGVLNDQVLDLAHGRSKPAQHKDLLKELKDIETLEKKEKEKALKKKRKEEGEEDLDE